MSQRPFPEPSTIDASPLSNELLRLKRLGPYEINQELGRGGMGIVFLARDPRLDRPIALKVVLPHLSQSPGIKERLLREARAAAQVSSDFVVPVFDVGEQDGIVYIAMPVLVGRTLEAHLQQVPILPLYEVIRIGKQVAQGLSAAHSKRFIHRDIKPGNIWLEDPDGRVKILDFGLARRQTEDIEISATGSILGTPHYMAPEQAKGGPIDGRTDLFSLGVVLFRMTTGRLPFTGASTFDILTSIANDPLPPIAALRSDTPPRLVTLIESLTSKRRENRPASAQAVIEELSTLDHAFTMVGMNQETFAKTREIPAVGQTEPGPIPATVTRQSTSIPPPIAKTIVERKPRRRFALVGLLALLVAAGAVGWLIRTEMQRSSRTQELERLCARSDELCRDGKYKDAIALADQALEREPKHALALARRGRAKFFLGDEEGALADCNAAIKSDPNLGQAYAYRAPIAWLTNSKAAGVKDGERAFELDVETGLARTCLALARLRAGDPQGAIQDATDAVQMHAEDAEARRVRGLCLAALNGPAAKVEFDQAVALSKNQAFYLAARADYLVDSAATLPEDKSEPLIVQAEQDADAAMKADPESGIACVAMANVQAAKGRWADVQSLCEQAIKLEPRLVAAYLRAADDLSPREAKQLERLKSALLMPIDLRDLKGGGDFTLGSLMTDIQIYVRNVTRSDLTLYINYESFPEEARQTVRDAKVNLSSLMDVSGEELLRDITLQKLLSVLCRQVSGTFWVTPEHIEIVELEMALLLSKSRSRCVQPSLICDSQLAKRELKRQFLEQAMERPIDLSELKGGGDFAAGSLITDLQKLISHKMRQNVPVYIDFRSFSPESRQTLRDTKVNLNFLFDATGENLLKNIKFRRHLETIARQFDAKVEVTYEYIRIAHTDAPNDVVDVAAEENKIAESILERKREEDRLKALPPDKKGGFVGQLFQGGNIGFGGGNVGFGGGNIGVDSPWRPYVTRHDFDGIEDDWDERWDFEEMPRFIRCKPRPESLRWLKRGIEEVPESGSLRLARAQIYLERALFKSALRDIDRCLDFNPNNAEAIRLRVIAREAKFRPVPRKEEMP